MEIEIHNILTFSLIEIGFRYDSVMGRNKYNCGFIERTAEESLIKYYLLDVINI
jgi:hypothetical protein